MEIVTREQFEIRSDLELVHLPTGLIFSAYPYNRPDDMLRSITVKAASAEKSSEFIDDQTLQKIRRMAEQIFLERARRNHVERS
jgi:hypothetical protein